MFLTIPKIMQKLLPQMICCPPDKPGQGNDIIYKVNLVYIITGTVPPVR